MELDEAAARAQRLSLAAREPDSGGASVREAFAAALEDDLDTPRAADVLERASGESLRELGAVLGLTLSD
jgi:hypothetical protein